MFRRIARLPCPHLTAAQERSNIIEVPDMIARPVRTACAEDLEFEGQDAAQYVCACGGRLDRREHAEEVLALCGGLVEEPEARERGEADIP